jgi:hypothetical protein
MPRYIENSHEKKLFEWSQRVYRVGVETNDLEKFSDLVVIRPPKTVPKNEFDKFVSELVSLNFLPILLPYDESVDVERFYPTDYFRDMGDKIANSGVGELGLLFRFLQPLLDNNQHKNLVQRQVETPIEISGGKYLHLNHQKIMAYAADRIFGNSEGKYLRRIFRFFEDLKLEGWKFLPIDMDGYRIPGKAYDSPEDLDFTVSMFLGRNGEPEFIVAESFAKQFPDVGVVHLIPDEEALKGGCNIADFRDGTILVYPNEHDTPTTKRILHERAHQDIQLIEGPANFVDGGGGLRCAMTSIRISS